MNSVAPPIQLDLGAQVYKIGTVSRLTLFEHGFRIKTIKKDITAKWTDVLQVRYGRQQEVWFFVPGTQYLLLNFDMKDGRSLGIEFSRLSILWGVENLYHNSKIKKLFRFLEQYNIPTLEVPYMKY